MCGSRNRRDASPESSKKTALPALPREPGKIKDADNDYTLLQYDAHGNRLNRLRLKAGVGAALDPATYVPNASDLAAWTRYGYDSYGNRLSVQRLRDLTAQSGPKLTFTYDAQGLNPIGASRTGLRNGVAVTDTATLAADSLGRETQGITADWYATQTAYDSVDRITQATDPLGNLRAYQYDANGNPAGESLTVQGAYGTTLADSVSATFDRSDRKATRLDAAGNVTAYQYDANGNLTQLTDPDGYTLGFAYDDADHWIQAFDQAGHAVSRSLDPSGRPRRVTDPNGDAVNYAYYDSTGDGRLKTVTDAAGRTTTYAYDANGNVTSVTDNAGRVTLTFYDALNRPVRVVSPSGLVSDSRLCTLAGVAVS